jgi:hypothetical protein
MMGCCLPVAQLLKVGKLGHGLEERIDDAWIGIGIESIFRHHLRIAQLVERWTVECNSHPSVTGSIPVSESYSFDTIFNLLPTHQRNIYQSFLHVMVIELNTVITCMYPTSC